MTDVEFSRLVSDLTTVAKELNRESDSLNALIERFETTLRQINIGIEVWLENDALRSTPWANGVTDVQLGFAKVAGAWSLAIRTAEYAGSETDLTLQEERGLGRLVDASREDRIAALEKFPALVAGLKREGESAMQAIQRARQFVEPKVAAASPPRKKVDW